MWLFSKYWLLTINLNRVTALIGNGYDKFYYMPKTPKDLITYSNLHMLYGLVSLSPLCRLGCRHAPSIKMGGLAHPCVLPYGRKPPPPTPPLFPTRTGAVRHPPLPSPPLLPFMGGRGHAFFFFGFGGSSPFSGHGSNILHFSVKLS